MKIRLDYVSNSSSSSFMIIGHPYSTEEFEEAVKKNGFKSSYDYEDDEEKEPIETDEIDTEEDVDEDEDEDVDYWDAYDWLEKKFGLKCHQGIENYGEDTICVGLEFDDMKDDETKSQFIDRIGDILERVFGKRPEIESMEDGGYEC